KDAEEGRRRVVYRPTTKARDIVEGKERKVKFSLTSSIVSALAAVSLFGYSRLGLSSGVSAGKTAEQVGSLTTMSQDAASYSSGAAQGGIDPATVVLGFSLLFLGISVSGLLYGLVLNRLGS
ncbi:MAG: hypothetical protein ABEJ66_01495, partial [Candidatus Nanohaloarchaea archaeon]